MSVVLGIPSWRCTPHWILFLLCGSWPCPGQLGWAFASLMSSAFPDALTLSVSFRLSLQLDCHSAKPPLWGVWWEDGREQQMCNLFSLGVSSQSGDRVWRVFYIFSRMPFRMQRLSPWHGTPRPTLQLSHPDWALSPLTKLEDSSRFHLRS